MFRSYWVLSDGRTELIDHCSLYFAFIRNVLLAIVNSLAFPIQIRKKLGSWEQDVLTTEDVIYVLQAHTIPIWPDR